jgi:glycosyltransferase involved in cell wall biosynthesis
MLSFIATSTLNCLTAPTRTTETRVKESSLDIKVLQIPATGNHPSEAKLDETNRLLELALIGSAIERGLEARASTAAPKLTVIIPAFNEIATIERVVNAVLDLPIDKQVVLVDDGSTDGTRELIQSLHGTRGIESILHPENRGKGAAIQSGFASARGEIVIIQDADLEYNPLDILDVIAPIVNGTADVVFGSRYLAESKQDASWVHRFGNRVLTGLSNLASGQKLTDMETCYKAFRRNILSKFSIEQRRFGFEPEITAKLAKNHIPIAEVPIRYQPRGWNEGKKIGILDLVNTLWCIIWYRFR